MSLELAAGRLDTERRAIHVLWMTAALSCDGDSFSMTAATSPSVEDLVMGLVPGSPRILFHHPLLAYENGREFLSAWFDAAEGKLDPFILVVEGSIPNEKLSREGCWAGLGADPETGQPIPTNDWVDRLTARASAVVAVGTCATYGGVPAMKNNPTGAMGLPDYLGWRWKSRDGFPIVCVPGCPAQPDNITQIILYVSLMVAGRAPMIELDELLRPAWLFNRTAHEGCDRAAFYEQGDFAGAYASHKCMVKLGCKGPVVKCNVGVRGWLRGRGGCPNVGGICIGCTMPGFPDKFMPFMDSALPVKVSTNLARFTYGPLLRLMRRQSMRRGSIEPAWRRQPVPVAAGGFRPRWETRESEVGLEFSTYTAAGRPARRYDVGEDEFVRVEVRDNRIVVCWSARVGPGSWLECLHDQVDGSSGALGLVILDEGSETRGDLTWRETRALVGSAEQQPKLVKVELGSTSMAWSPAPDAAGESGAEVAVSAPALEFARVRELMTASCTAAVSLVVDEVLAQARTARLWSRR